MKFNTIEQLLSRLDYGTWAEAAEFPKSFANSDGNHPL